MPPTYKLYDPVIAGQQDKLLGIVAAVQGLLEIDALVDGMIDACHEAIECEWVSINDIEIPADGHVISVVRPDLPRELYDEFGKYAHQNPLLRRHIDSRDGRAYRFSDVISVEDFRALDLYKFVYEPIGVNHQMAFMLQSPAGRVLAVVLSRREHDFTDEERDLANAARPFLIQAWTNAVEYSALRDELLARTSNGPAMVRPPLTELINRGLTERQAEVLVLAACGRSNSDAADALEISERTVEKHLERCYRALEVSGRSEAAAVVWSMISDYAAAPEPGRRGLDGHAPAGARDQ